MANILIDYVLLIENDYIIMKCLKKLRELKMNIVIEFVVKDIFKAASFYTKYFGFEIEFSEYDPVSWMQLKNENTTLMLVTYDYAKEDIEGFKEYTSSTNLY